MANPTGAIVRSPRRRDRADVPSLPADASASSSHCVSPSSAAGFLDSRAVRDHRLGDHGGAVVTDVRRQCGDQRRRPQRQCRASVTRHLEQAMPLSASSVAAVAHSSMLASRLAAMTGIAVRELQGRHRRRERDRRVVADDLRGDLLHHLRDDGVDLAGHDRTARLQRRAALISPRPPFGPGAEQSEVAGDLVERQGDDLQVSRQPRPWRLGWTAPRSGRRLR